MILRTVDFPLPMFPSMEMKRGLFLGGNIITNFIYWVVFKFALNSFENGFQGVAN
jgi:hypothetical protein